MRNSNHDNGLVAELGMPDPRDGYGRFRHTACVWPDFLDSEPGRRIRVILVDDDPHIRRVIAGELCSDLRTELVGQAHCARSGKRLISNTEFDVMLVDLQLGNGSGFDLIEHMKHVRAHAEAIVVSTMDDEQSAIRAFERGATGYLVKSTWFGSFPQAVLQVCSGGASISPNLARRLLQRFSAPAVPAATSRCGAPLSERESQVLREISRGFTSQDIAGRLSLSVQTVNTHVRNIYRKLEVRSRAQAVAQAARQRLI